MFFHLNVHVIKHTVQLIMFFVFRIVAITLWYTDVNWNTSRHSHRGINSKIVQAIKLNTFGTWFGYNKQLFQPSLVETVDLF